MSHSVIKNISVDSNSIWWSSKSVLVTGIQLEKEQNKYSIPVERINASQFDGEITSFAAIKWTFGSELRDILELNSSDIITVTNIELEFMYQKSNSKLPINQLEIVAISDPAPLSASDLWDSINSSTVILATITLDKNAKTLYKANIGIKDSIGADILGTAFKNDGDFCIAIRRKMIDESEDGQILIGGKNLLYGENEDWRLSSDSEVSFSTKLNITYIVDDKDHIQHEMRYTTSDPTTSQTNGSNSLGGFTALNQVYTRVQIGDFINSSQDSMTIFESDDPPTETGILQVGPEIIRFGTINGNELSSLTRGVINDQGFPSSLDPFAEYVHYLELDKLFDQNITNEDTYRCVSIINTTNFRAENIRIALIQDKDSDVQIDAGIETPRFETRYGTLSEEITSESTVVLSESDGVRNNSAGFFDGGHIIIDPNGSAFHAIIDSYDDNGAEAEFILDRTLTTFSAGTEFRINPAPCQIIRNQTTRPVENSGFFFGFFNEGGSNYLSFDGIHENQGSLEQYDVFYIWLKRSIKSNVKRSSSTGAILLIRFTDTAAS